ncbi:hypothetical protein R3P38DRAFT_2814978 [Favolaschia claudopus]|uniref:Uncharacterized protein n=1 Tax=Favolaschia claudopus TaxID=2862362 RepID=A0AAV9Z262_9AGAR
MAGRRYLAAPTLRSIRATAPVEAAIQRVEGGQRAAYSRYSGSGGAPDDLERAAGAEEGGGQYGGRRGATRASIGGGKSAGGAGGRGARVRELPVGIGTPYTAAIIRVLDTARQHEDLMRGEIGGDEACLAPAYIVAIFE